MIWKVLDVLFVIAALVAYITTIYFLFSIYENPGRLQHDNSRKGYWGFICTLFVLIFFFAGGIHTLLFFVPDKWGWVNDEGEWISVKWIISLIVGGILYIFALTRVPKLFLRSKLIDEIEYGSNITELEKYEKNHTLGEYAETHWTIEQIEKKRKEYASLASYLEARKKEIENFK
ncbi:MAG: hypothetical protein ABH952_08060 [Candidatus Omnitrophota bacterium]